MLRVRAVCVCACFIALRFLYFGRAWVGCVINICVALEADAVLQARVARSSQAAQVSGASEVYIAV